MGIERRRYPRVRADFGVKYKIKDSDSSPVKAVSVNISAGGIMMKISEKLASDSLLELTIVLPPPYGTIDTLGRVVYVLENYWEEYPPYRCGIEFRGLKEIDKKQLGEFVDEELKKLNWESWF